MKRIVREVSDFRKIGSEILLKIDDNYYEKWTVEIFDPNYGYSGQLYLKDQEGKKRWLRLENNESIVQQITFDQALSEVVEKPIIINSPKMTHFTCGYLTKGRLRLISQELRYYTMDETKIFNNWMKGTQFYQSEQGIKLFEDMATLIRMATGSS